MRSGGPRAPKIRGVLDGVGGASLPDTHISLGKRGCAAHKFHRPSTKLLNEQTSHRQRQTEIRKLPKTRPATDPAAQNEGWEKAEEAGEIYATPYSVAQGLAVNRTVLRRQPDGSMMALNQVFITAKGAGHVAQDAGPFCGWGCMMVTRVGCCCWSARWSQAIRSSYRSTPGLRKNRWY